MPGQYKSIDGVRYERELLDIADETTAPITMQRAARLWYAALDGNKITDTEKRTLQYICRQYKVQAAAKTWIADKLKRHGTWVAHAAKNGGKAKGYKSFNGAKYDAALLEQADQMIRTSSKITVHGAEDLLDNSLDGKGITSVEKKTLEHIMQAYKCDKAAIKLIQAAIREFQCINRYGDLQPADDADQAQPEPVAMRELPMSEDIPVPEPVDDAAAPSLLSRVGNKMVSLFSSRATSSTSSAQLALPAPSVVGESDAIVPVESWARTLVRSSLKAQKPDVGDVVLTAKLKEIFSSVDTSGDGKISKIELIKACKRDGQIADFFGLARSIQEGSTRDAMENIFQAIDKDTSREIDWNEFQHFFQHGSNGAAASGVKRLHDSTEQPHAKRLKASGA